MIIKTDICSFQRAALAKVWDEGRKSYNRTYFSGGLSDNDKATVLSLLSYDQSPEYISAIENERSYILSKIEKAKKPKNFPGGPYTSSIPHAQNQEGLPEKPQGAKKGKKGKKVAMSQENDELKEELQALSLVPPEATEEVVAYPSLPLPKKGRSLTTLRLLFPNATSDHKGSVRWPDFTELMAELGFWAEHRGGSEWTFRGFATTTGNKIPNAARADDSASMSTGGAGAEAGTGDDKDGAEVGKAAGKDAGNQDEAAAEEKVKQSIVIHQPHPDPTMPAVRLQWIGKRLWKRFGWCRESFEGL